MNRNLVKTVLSRGGSIIPLIINPQDSKGLGLMNPSILIDKTKILLNLRNINYTLYHCEGSQLLNGRWGPLSYLHPENDMHLRTWNYMCELNPQTLEIEKYWLTDTTQFDKEPLWDFVGLEDARLVRWEGKLYQCGVRRDTTPNGVGRMELTELEEKDESQLQPGESKYKEISRTRIEPPGPPTYCEKNWMPVLDMPYHFVKWSNPVQVVKANLLTRMSETIYLGNSVIPGVRDFRGGSQVIPWKGYRICLIHEVNLFNNKLQQKDASYFHRFLIWDKNWNIVGMSDPFSFMDGEIEFGCGLTFYKGDMLLTFGFQDNAAFVLRVPENIIDEVVGMKKIIFDWGRMNDNPELKKSVIEEIFNKDLYQKYFSVEPGDVVVDVGASVGPFTAKILANKPKKVYCIEPHKDFFSTLQKNTKHDNAVICINKAIHFKNEPVVYDEMWGNKKYARGVTFKTFLKSYNIPKIDFLKLDCEGAEYEILNIQNLEWIKNNVKKIAGEFHLFTASQRNAFQTFYRLYKDDFNIKVCYMDGSEVNEDPEKIPAEAFMVYIDNRDKQVKSTKIEVAVKNFEKAILNVPKEPEKESYMSVITKNSSQAHPFVKEMLKPEKWRAASWPTLEITTNILDKGCINDCVFCPQRILTNKYSGEIVLTLENFKKALETVPKEITIIFSGFSEPFMNKETIDMILYAHKKGHKLAIFTTGVGLSIKDFDRIKHIPFSSGPENPILSYKGEPMLNGGFTLHIPDQEEYAKHPITKKYIQLLEHIKNSWNEIKGIRIVCMGTVHDKVKHIFAGALPIEIWSRANNVNKEMDLKPELKALEGKGLWKSAYRGEGPTTCGLDEKLYHNVLMPNGDLVLCCMDYDQEHILGNLFTQKYEDIIPELNTPFNICRFCENGINL